MSTYRNTAAALMLALASAMAGCASNETPLGEVAPEELWVQGVEAFNAEEWDDAIRLLDRFVFTAGVDPRVNQARYYIGQAYFNDEQFITAGAEFARLAGELGRTELADDARFMACRAYEELSPGPQLDQEYTRGAIEHCEGLLTYFPDSEFADDARAVVDRMRNRLGEKVFETGTWYERRRAYDSAIIYYEQVADDYGDTDWAPRALRRLIGIYEELGYAEEVQETRDRLEREHPGSGGADQVERQR